MRHLSCLQALNLGQVEDAFEVNEREWKKKEVFMIECSTSVL